MLNRNHRTGKFTKHKTQLKTITGNKAYHKIKLSFNENNVKQTS